MATYEDSPSFTFTTPEQRRQRFLHDVDDTAHDKWHFCDSPSPIPAPRFQGEEQDENKSPELLDQHWSFAHSHFRRRNKLETRLEELQKDVASLTLKLRTNGSRNTSLDTSSFLYPLKEMKSYKTPTIMDTRRKSAKEIVAGTGIKSSAVKTLRELHDVTTERDQLRFELEKTKRALVAAEKKVQTAQKGQKAYEKLKVHCDSLQESLNLSEKIRGRQKKVLQQLQLQQQQQQRKDIQTPSSLAKRSASGGLKTRDGSKLRELISQNFPTSKQLQQNNKAQEYTHTDYDILDSLVASSYHQDEEEDAGLSTHEQAPSEPTAATSQAKIPRSKLKSTTPTSKSHRHNFDSLLQVETPQFSTRRPTRIATPSHRRPSQTQSQQREVTRQAVRWARSRGGAGDRSTSTTRVPMRKISTENRPKNSFLAPTQASMRRLHDLPRRGDQSRPPFVV